MDLWERDDDGRWIKLPQELFKGILRHYCANRPVSVARDFGSLLRTLLNAKNLLRAVETYVRGTHLLHLFYCNIVIQPIQSGIVQNKYYRNIPR
jgi:hypothetical protein